MIPSCYYDGAGSKFCLLLLPVPCCVCISYSLLPAKGKGSFISTTCLLFVCIFVHGLMAAQSVSTAYIERERGAMATRISFVRSREALLDICYHCLCFPSSLLVHYCWRGFNFLPLLPLLFITIAASFNTLPLLPSCLRLLRLPFRCCFIHCHCCLVHHLCREHKKVGFVLK